MFDDLHNRPSNPATPAEQFSDAESDQLFGNCSRPQKSRQASGFIQKGTSTIPLTPIDMDNRPTNPTTPLDMDFSNHAQALLEGRRGRPNKPRYNSSYFPKGARHVSSQQYHSHQQKTKAPHADVTNRPSNPVTPFERSFDNECDSLFGNCRSSNGRPNAGDRSTTAPHRIVRRSTPSPNRRPAKGHHQLGSELFLGNGTTYRKARPQVPNRAKTTSSPLMV